MRWCSLAERFTDYVVYDVFTDAAFGGNQLAVIPDASALAEDQLQRIAREFNFSETTFVYPPDDTMEVPFAGHPTIGTAIALRDAGATGNIILELGIGPIPCTYLGDTAAFTVTAPLERFSTPDPAFVAKALSLPADAVATTTHPPVQAGVGLPFVIVELTNRAQLSQCQPVTDVFRTGAETYPSHLDFAIYAYVRDGNQIDARMFAPLDNIPEDPATGSAAAALAALLTDITGHAQTLEILQGADMGRPSIIGARTTLADPAPVTISGKAVRTMAGQLTL